jgi:hypothetical protein
MRPPATCYGWQSSWQGSLCPALDGVWDSNGTLRAATDAGIAAVTALPMYGHAGRCARLTPLALGRLPLGVLLGMTHYAGNAG